MKKALLLSLLALVCGLVLGGLIGGGFFSVRQPPSNTAAISLSTAQTDRRGATAPPTADPLDPSDNGPLLDRADQVLDALKNRDYAALSRLVHPQLGVTLTPYSTVDPDRDNVLTPAQVARLAEDKEARIWGLYDGSGAPIKCTGAEYFDRYVFNADYTQAPQVGVDTVLISGNALENVADAYQGARFVEYHFPGIDPALEGFDWCSLKLVFQEWNNDWYLVGLIHGEWTI